MRAKRDFLTELRSGEEGDFEVNKDNDILFVVSKSSNLMFYQFDEQIDSPQGLLMPFGDTFNCMKEYLPKLKKFDDLSPREWIEKAANNETVFAPSPEDSKQ